MNFVLTLCSAVLIEFDYLHCEMSTYLMLVLMMMPS